MKSKQAVIYILFFLVFAFSFLSIARAIQDPEQIPPANRFSFTYDVTVKELPTDFGEFNLWVPLAKTNEQQKILKREIESPYKYRILKDPKFGNEYLYLSFKEAPEESVNLRIKYQVETQGKKVNGKPEALIKGRGDDLEVYLSASKLVVINNEIRQIAQEVTAGLDGELAKARSIYDYVMENMAYDKTGADWGRGDTQYACDVGKGNCTDFHSLFISVARASGIPARFKIGAQIPWEKEEGKISYHCWAEFYLPGDGWIPVDASEAWKNSVFKEYYFGSTDPGKFTISMGRDIAVSKMKNKELINIFIYPYAEVDGKPFKGIDSKFSFQRKLMKGANI